jgi:hypothetical protein
MTILILETEHALTALIEQFDGASEIAVDDGNTGAAAALDAAQAWLAGEVCREGVDAPYRLAIPTDLVGTMSAAVENINEAPDAYDDYAAQDARIEA